MFFFFFFFVCKTVLAVFVWQKSCPCAIKSSNKFKQMENQDLCICSTGTTMNGLIKCRKNCDAISHTPLWLVAILSLFLTLPHCITGGFWLWNISFFFNQAVSVTCLLKVRRCTSLTVQMSIGNREKQTNLKPNQVVQAGRNRGRGVTLWKCNVLCFYLGFLVIWYMHCNPALQSVIKKGTSRNFISHNHTSLTQNCKFQLQYEQQLSDASACYFQGDSACYLILCASQYRVRPSCSCLLALSKRGKERLKPSESSSWMGV